MVWSTGKPIRQSCVIPSIWNSQPASPGLVIQSWEAVGKSGKFGRESVGLSWWTWNFNSGSMLLGVERHSSFATWAWGNGCRFEKRSGSCYDWKSLKNPCHGQYKPFHGLRYPIKKGMHHASWNRDQLSGSATRLNQIDLVPSILLPSNSSSWFDLLILYNFCWVLISRALEISEHTVAINSQKCKVLKRKCITGNSFSTALRKRGRWPISARQAGATWWWRTDTTAMLSIAAARTRIMLHFTETLCLCM